jgi:excisionase family DNA binding protein
MGQYFGRETVSIIQACERARVSRRTVYNWLVEGKVQFVRTAGGSVRILADTLPRPVARARPHVHHPPRGDTTSA